MSRGDDRSTSGDRCPTRARPLILTRRARVAVAKEQACRRSEPRARRGWLRALDFVLTDEGRDARALSPEELIELAARPLDGRASRETLKEGWEYANRRSWLEEHGTGRWRLTSTAREELHAIRRRITEPNPVEGVKAIMKWAVPAGAIGAAGLLSGKYLTTGIAIVVLCATVALGFVLAALISKLLDRPTDRWIARRACDWLDGRRVVWWILRLPAVNGDFHRLYQSQDDAELHEQ